MPAPPFERRAERYGKCARFGRVLVRRSYLEIEGQILAKSRGFIKFDPERQVVYLDSDFLAPKDANGFDLPMHRVLERRSGRNVRKERPILNGDAKCDVKTIAPKRERLNGRFNGGRIILRFLVLAFVASLGSPRPTELEPFFEDVRDVALRRGRHPLHSSDVRPT
jgi:hypothetical protein